MWTKEQLCLLSDLDNHRIVYDGFEYRWESNITGTWELQCCKLFTEHAVAMSFLLFNIPRWYNQHYKLSKKEFKKRNKITIQIGKYCNDDTLTTKEKIFAILELDNTLTNRELSNILDITRQTVSRHQNNYESKQNDI